MPQNDCEFLFLYACWCVGYQQVDSSKKAVRLAVKYSEFPLKGDTPKSLFDMQSELPQTEMKKNTYDDKSDFYS